jgi:hypothetical protein
VSKRDALYDRIDAAFLERVNHVAVAVSAQAFRDGCTIEQAIGRVRNACLLLEEWRDRHYADVDGMKSTELN